MILPDYLLMQASADVDISKSPPPTISLSLPPACTTGDRVLNISKDQRVSRLETSIKYALGSSLRRKERAKEHGESGSYEHTLNFSFGASCRCPNPKISESRLQSQGSVKNHERRSTSNIPNASGNVTEPMTSRLWNPFVPEGPRSHSTARSAALNRTTNDEINSVPCRLPPTSKPSRRNVLLSSHAPRSPIPSLNAVHTKTLMTHLRAGSAPRRHT